MKLLVQNRENVEKLCRMEWGDPFTVISITNPGSAQVNLNNKMLVEVLRLSFWDLDKPSKELTELFTKDHAIQVLEFAERHRKKLIIVHCSLGVSRSAAVAAALSKIYTGDDKFYFLKYVPNMHVYSLIIKTHNELGGRKEI